MKTVAKISDHMIHITLIFSYTLIMFAFSTRRCEAQTQIVLKLSVYLQSRSVYADPADNYTVRITEVFDGISVEENNKLTRFRSRLKSNGYYIISVSKGGFVTKTFTFSTVEVNPELKYIYNTEIILKNDKVADYDGRYPVAHVAFDKASENFLTTILTYPNGSR